MDCDAAPLLHADRGAVGLREVEIDMTIGGKAVHHELRAFGIAARHVAVGDNIRVSKIDEAFGVELGTRTPGIVHLVGENGVLIDRHALPGIRGPGRG